MAKQKERLSVVEKLLLSPSEAVALQQMADELIVSKASILRRGLQMMLANHELQREFHEEKLSRLFPVPTMPSSDQD